MTDKKERIVPNKTLETTVAPQEGKIDLGKKMDPRHVMKVVVKDIPVSSQPANTPQASQGTTGGDTGQTKK